MIRTIASLLLSLPLACSASLPDIQIQNVTPCDKTPGMADSHVLALSWEPAYCETYGYQAGKPECLKLDSRSYHSKNMTLHGLWPNQKACGLKYNYCGVDSLPHHCSYPALNLNEDVSNRLKQFMPSYAYGSCLERHEWNSHGTCQILSSSEYYGLAVRLTEEVNNSSFGGFLKNHLGKTVDLNQLYNEAEKALGDDAQKKIFFGCRHGRLVDMYIYLPALIPYNEALNNLVAKAQPNKKRNDCPQQVKISNFYAVA